MSTYISPVVVAKLVRAELKKSFPDIKFAVKSKHSIRVSWVDGPTEKQVEAVAGHFHGCEFDGMQDLETYNDSPYGNSYIFFNRHYTEAFLKKCAVEVAKEYGFKEPTIETYGEYSSYGLTTDWVGNAHGEYYWGNDRVAQRYANETEA
jgi:hypothetical protein